MNLISSPLTLNGKEVRMTSAKQSRSRMMGNYHVRFCMGVRGSDTPFDPTKWERQCAYCSAENVPLQVEHIPPKASGGTNRISNLCLACEPCNTKKGTQDIKIFLAKKPDVLKKILAQAKRPLKDATAVNSTRWALFERLKETGKMIITGSGWLTKFNRIRLELQKTHFFDAACVGDTSNISVLANQPLNTKATAHGSTQMCRTDKFGFPSR